MRLTLLARKNQRRAPPALHYPRGADTDDAAMPALPFQHQAVSILQLGRGLDPGMNFLDDALLRLLAIAVELVQFHRHLGGLRRVLLGDWPVNPLGHINATSGVQSRSHAKRDVAGA